MEKRIIFTNSEYILLSEARCGGLICTFDEIRCKEIINIKNGRRLGYADDVEFDTCTAKICRLVIFGKAKFFGLFGREDDMEISWGDIEVIGEDTILVSCDFPIRTKNSFSKLKNLFK